MVMAAQIMATTTKELWRKTATYVEIRFCGWSNIAWKNFIVMTFFGTKINSQFEY